MVVRRIKIRSAAEFRQRFARRIVISSVVEKSLLQNGHRLM